MKKKSMKKGLALGALMTFVITGSAFATDVESLPMSDGKLLDNYKYTETINVAAGKNITIDLNGKDISRADDLDKNTAKIGIEINGVLTIKDSSDNWGSITGKDTSVKVNGEDAKLILNSGRIVGKRILVSTDALAEILGGEISVKATGISIEKLGRVIFNDGKISTDGGSGTGVSIISGGNLIMNGGEIEAIGTAAKGISVSTGNAMATINGGIIKADYSDSINQNNKSYGIQVVYKGAVLNVNGGEISGKNSGIFAEAGTVNITGSANIKSLSGSTISNGILLMPSAKSASDYTAPATVFLNISGGTIESSGAAIIGNGNKHGTEINITGGSIKGDLGIYHPQYGKLNIGGNAQITGVDSGIEMRAGVLNIDGGEITASAKEFSANSNGSGSTIAGAAVAVSQHSTNLPLEVTINDGKFTGIYALYENDLQDEKDRDKIKLSVTGGTFNGKIYSENCKGFITGGTFNDPSAFAYLAKNADINFKLDKDYSGDDTVNIAQGKVNMDLAGNSYKGTINVDGGTLQTKSVQAFANGLDATGTNVKDSGELKNYLKIETGILALEDEFYNLDYANSAQSKIGNASLTMLGTLVNDDGTEKNETTIEELFNSSITHANTDVFVSDDKSNLVIGSNKLPQNESDLDNAETHNNSLGVKTLDMGDDSKILVTGDKEFTLIGDGQDTVKTTAESLEIVVGNDDLGAGTLKLGNEAAGNGGVLNAEVTVNDNGVVSAQKAMYEVKNIKTFDENTSGAKIVVNNGGTLKVDDLQINENTVVNVGNNESAGTIIVENASLNGAIVFLDPAWNVGSGTIQEASHGAFSYGAKQNVDGKFVVGQNSVLTLGSSDVNQAITAFSKVSATTGMTWGKDDITAAAYLANPVKLAENGAIIIDGSKTTEPSQDSIKEAEFNAANQSLLMVNGEQIKEVAAISGIKTATVADGAKLYIDGAKKGEVYKILAGADENTAINAAWKLENIKADNALLKFVKDEDAANEFNVTTQTTSAKDVYGDELLTPNVVDAIMENLKDGDAAYDFVSAAANTSINADTKAQALALNSAAAMGELAGVTHGTYSMSNIMTDAVNAHLSIANHSAEYGKDIWAHYIHNKENVNGMALSALSADYDAQYNGIVVGADLMRKGKTTVGAALTYADGNINGANSVSSNKNDAEYYGVSVYGKIDNGDSAVLGDISYLHSKNDLEQQNSGKLLTASSKADAFSIGVKAEKKFTAGKANLTPYAGLRYMHLGVGNYTNNLGMRYDVDAQNLWLLPVGVKYSQEVKQGDWTIRPLVDVGYVWTLGDRDTNQTVSMGASDRFGFNTADKGSFVSRFAIEAEKSNVSYGLGYEYQKGDTVKANKWMANVVFAF